MKSLVLAALLIILSCATLSDAEAYPGQECWTPTACGHCEVCAKAHSWDPSGVCMVISGCH